jgi:ElaB/YqjD/DUF883 family membrane-anchored ribosome-binding protein
MSANYPAGPTDNDADVGSRTATSARSTYEDNKSPARSGGPDSGRRQTAESLRSDLSNLKTDLDALVARSSSLSEQELSESYARMMTKFSSMRFAAKGIAAEAGRQLNQGVDMTTDYVRAKPLQSVAMAAGGGLLLGILVARRT